MRNKAFDELYLILKKIDIYTEEKILEKIDKLDRYMKEILEKNKSVNLTNILDEEEFVRKHYIDSISVIEADEFRKAETIIDIGTGGGFPGIPLAILFEEKKFVLVDALKKRIDIINELCEKINIGNVMAYHGRAEDLAREMRFREVFDLALSRAVSSVSTLLEITTPFIKKDGYLIAHKGPKGIEEISESQKALEKLNLVYEGYIKDKYQKDVNHILIKVKKIEETPIEYPRRAGIPQKKPL